MIFVASSGLDILLMCHLIRNLSTWVDFWTFLPLPPQFDNSTSGINRVCMHLESPRKSMNLKIRTQDFKSSCKVREKTLKSEGKATSYQELDETIVHLMEQPKETSTSTNLASIL